MPYNSETGLYERRSTTVIDATPDGDTVAVAIDTKLDQATDDAVTDLNHHDANGNHYPATSVGSDSRFLKQSPAGVVSWADGVVAADAALKDFSNVTDGAIASAKLANVAPAKVTQDASNRFVTDTEKSTWSTAATKAGVESVLTGTITSHTHSAASESAAGLVELATTAEAAAGADTSRAVTAAGVDAYHKTRNIVLSANAPASGVAVDFGSDVSPLPVGIKRLNVLFDRVGLSGSSNILIRVGSPGIVSSGYVSASTGGQSMMGNSTSTSGFIIRISNATSSISGLYRLDIENSKVTGSGITGSGGVFMSVGVVPISGVIDRIRVTTSNGIDQFDSGTITISWEF